MFKVYGFGLWRRESFGRISEEQKQIIRLPHQFCVRSNLEDLILWMVSEVSMSSRGSG